MHVSPQTALRNRRIIWGATPTSPLGSGVQGAGHAADPDAGVDRRDAGNGDGCCCHEGCNGLGGSEQCRGNADGGAHGAAALDLGSSAFNPSTITYLANCDPGDESDADRRARTP